jgi:recombination protein RecR
LKTSDPITNLINAFSRLPGIGERTASRLAFFVMNQPPDLAEDLARSLLEIKEKVGLCTRCCNLTEGELCTICRSTKRDHSVVCVVESTPDLRAIENTGEFRGLYHVLHGLISPLEGVGPDDVHLKELLMRMQTGDDETAIEEVIVATSPSVDGEATALYLSKLLKPMEVRVTRIASGVPIGGELEYVDRVTLSRAMSQRRDL